MDQDNGKMDQNEGKKSTSPKSWDIYNIFLTIALKNSLLSVKNR